VTSNAKLRHLQQIKVHFGTCFQTSNSMHVDLSAFNTFLKHISCHLRLTDDLLRYDQTYGVKGVNEDSLAI
jgi:hypothetical protein